MRYDLMQKTLLDGVDLTNAEKTTLREALLLWDEAEQQEITLESLLTSEDYYPDWEILNDVTPFR